MTETEMLKEPRIIVAKVAHADQASGRAPAHVLQAKVKVRIVVMPGKAVIHYKVPLAKDSQNPEGDSEELDLADPPMSASDGV